jgi:S-adenosylmethionine:tRNA ribosyltransferase-isomerase
MIPTRRLDYVLPPGLIAQAPADRRDGSRLLVVDRASHSVDHRRFDELPSFLRPGDILVRNNAAVLPARLSGRRPSGGKVECLLLRKEGGDPAGGELWRCLVKPGRRLREGASFEAADGALHGTVASVDGDGPVLVRFAVRGARSVEEAANRSGDIPLPPYISRADRSLREVDRERYQTVYADRGRQVAVAAPTAGLHFSSELLARIRDRGVRTADLTLHVGLGTFRPIATESVEEHPIHGEAYEIPLETQRAVLAPDGARRIAVGTTSVRTVEDFLSKHRAATGGTHLDVARLFIYPPRRFAGIDALVTNFHQPRSTLLCLVSAFLTPGSPDGIDWLMDIYAEAIRMRYRFLSYGDAMLVL